jgi:DNA-binding Xre family transcriptional regulator
MTTEEKLKSLILSEYGTISAFTKKAGIPNSTLVTILSRGVKNSNASNIKKICNTLDISTDDLYLGKITPNKPEKTRKPVTDLRDVLSFARMQMSVYNDLTLNGEPLSDDDITFIADMFDIIIEVVQKKQRREKQ